MLFKWLDSFTCKFVSDMFRYHRYWCIEINIQCSFLNLNAFGLKETIYSKFNAYYILRFSGVTWSPKIFNAASVPLRWVVKLRFESRRSELCVTNIWMLLVYTKKSITDLHKTMNKSCYKMISVYRFPEILLIFS